LVTSPDKALTVLPMTLVGQLVFSGAWVPLNAPVLRQLRDLSSAHWTVHAVRSTVNVDPGDWWLSVFALLALSAAALVATMALVHRSVLPTRIGEARARIASHMTPGMRLVAGAAVIAAVVLGVSENKGTASDFIRRPKLLAAPAALPPNHPPVATAMVPPAPAPATDALAAAEAAKQQMAAQAAQAIAAAEAAKQQIARQQAALADLQKKAAAVQVPVTTAVTAVSTAAQVVPTPAPATTTTTAAPQPAPPERTLIGSLLHPFG